MSKYIRDHWIDIAALAVAFVSFLFSTFPQINPFNDNLIEKANAGDVDSQMTLANLYYEIGNTGESVQWYTVATSHSGDHQAKAINNLAVIYLSDDRFDATRQENEIDAMKMFRAAAELGEVDAAKNLYLLLISHPKEIFGEEYSETMDLAKKQLQDNNVSINSMDKYYTEWELVETVTDELLPKDKGEYKCILISSKLIIQNGYPVWSHTYEIYRKKDNVDPPEYIYMKVK